MSLEGQGVSAMTDDAMNGFEQRHLDRWWEVTRRYLFPDSCGAGVSTSSGLRQRGSPAGWEGEALVIETTMLGEKMNQEYRIDDGTKRLVTSTVAQAPEAQPVSYRLAYDRRQPEADGEQACRNTEPVQVETR